MKQEKIIEKNNKNTAGWKSSSSFGKFDATALESLIGLLNQKQFFRVLDRQLQAKVAAGKKELSGTQGIISNWPNIQY